MIPPQEGRGAAPRHVSLVALPDTVVPTLFDIYDVLNAFDLMDASSRRPFEIESREPGRGDDQAIAARRAHVQAAVRRRNRAHADRVRTAPAHRGRQAPARADRRLGRRDQPAFFRRLFRRTTGLSPSAYRKRFRIPEFART